MIETISNITAIATYKTFAFPINIAPGKINGEDSGNINEKYTNNVYFINVFID